MLLCLCVYIFVYLCVHSFILIDILTYQHLTLKSRAIIYFADVIADNLLVPPTCNKSLFSYCYFFLFLSLVALIFECILKSLSRFVSFRIDCEPHFFYFFFKRKAFFPVMHHVCTFDYLPKLFLFFLLITSGMTIPEIDIAAR